MNSAPDSQITIVALRSLSDAFSYSWVTDEWEAETYLKGVEQF